MKITVRIHGVIDAELETPETTVSALGTRDWCTWQANQYAMAREFIGKCSEEACRISKAHRYQETEKA